MTQDVNTALFVINSPFQAICAVEAVYYYRISTPVFVVLQGQQHQVNISTKKILNLNNFDYNKLIYRSFIELFKQSPKDISTLNLDKSSYDLIFIGDFFSPLHRVFASYFFSKNNKFIYLDDGSSTIEAFHWGLKARGYSKMNVFIKTSIANIIFLFNRKKTSEFFSVFPEGQKNFVVTQNKLKHLKKKLKKRNKFGVYILGSNLSNMNLIKEKMYLSILDKIIQHSLSSFPNERIFYCPHRGESQELTQRITSKFELNVYKSQYTIEIDFVLKNNNPVSIYSFGSTASYTLKKLYPDSFMYAIYPKTFRKKLNRTYDMIGEVYSKAGIVTIY